MISRRFLLLFLLMSASVTLTFAQSSPGLPMAVYVLEFQTDIKGDNASAASDMSVAMETTLSARRAAFRILERRDLSQFVRQHKLERDMQSLVKGEKASPQLIQQLQGADGFVRGELINRPDGVTLTVSLIRLNSEKVWQGQRRHALIDWLNGDVRQREAEALAAEAAAALLPKAADAKHGDDGPHGIDLASSGHCPEAMPFLQNAVVADTENAELYFWMGRCQIAAKEFAPATQNLTKALLRNPRRADILVERARSLAAQMLLSRALEDIDQALRLDAENLPAIELRGDLMLKTGKYGDAVRAYYEVFERGASRNRCVKLVEAYRKNGASDAAVKLEPGCASLR